MKLRKPMEAAVGLALLASGACANATVFTGSINGGGFARPDTSCAPLPFRGLLNGGTGSSDLGSFTYSQDICLSGANGPLQGTFLMNFGGSTLFGSLAGLASPNMLTPGTANLALTYTVLGGSGAFLNATGTFGGTALSDPRNGPPSLFALNFTGDVDAPALPEPGTWALLLLGFAAIGLRMRRQRWSAASAHQIA